MIGEAVRAMVAAAIRASRAEQEERFSESFNMLMRSQIGVVQGWVSRCEKHVDRLDSRVMQQDETMDSMRVEMEEIRRELALAKAAALAAPGLAPSQVLG